MIDCEIRVLVEGRVERGKVVDSKENCVLVFKDNLMSYVLVIIITLINFNL